MTENKCTLCGGSGEILVKEKYEPTGLYRLCTSYCICKKARLVQDEFKVLDCMGNTYIPLDKMDKRLQFESNVDLEKIPNYIIFGNKMDFCANMKSFIIRHRFSSNPMKIFCKSSISIIHDFFVKQDDGSSLRLSDLLSYHLVVLLFDNEEPNKALQPCIAQVLNMRLWHKKPTWLYTAKPLGVCMEYINPRADYNSPNLPEYIKQFTEINLSSTGTSNESRIRELQDRASRM